MKKLTVNYPGLALALALGIGAGSARATIIFDSLYGAGSALLAVTTGTAAQQYKTVTGGTLFAQAFTTGNNGHVIDSISLYGSSSAAVGTTTLTIYTNLGTGNASAPGSVVEMLTSPATITAAAGVNTFTGTSTVLAGNTVYWAVLDNSDTGIRWNKSSYAVAGSVLGYQYLNGENDPLVWAANTSSSTLAMQVNATAVPEPSTYVLAGVGLAALVWLRRRRNSDAQGGSAAGLMPA